MELHIDGVPMKDMTYWWGTLSSDKPMCEHAAFGWHGLKQMRHAEMAKENQFFSIIWTIPFQTKPTFSCLSCLREPTRCVLKKGLWIFQRKRHGCKGLFQLWHWNTIRVHHQTLAADRGCIAEARWKRAWGKHGTDARRWCHRQPSACLGLWLFKINFPFYFEPLQPLGLDPAVCCDARCANSLHVLRLEGELGYSDG